MNYLPLPLDEKKGAIMEFHAELPQLNSPVLIAAFEGWNDGANSATATVRHLSDQWDAQLLATVDPESYYDFQVQRPIINIESKGVRSLTWPATSVSIARLANSSHDAVLVNGIEPSMRWPSFCAELLDLAESLRVKQVIVLGALLAATPHTRPVPITGFASDATLASRLGFETTTYEGPTGIVGVLQSEAQDAGFSAVSLWAQVPYYVAEPPCPKATLALLAMLEDLVDASIDLGDLPEDAQAWQRGAEELAADDPDVAEYVQQLEEVRDAADLPEASGEAIARDFQRYLRRRDS